MTEARRILVVEDDASMRSILRFNLEEEGFVVELARRGDEALAHLPEGSLHAPFDLVLTDVKMPGADGMAVLRAARACHDEVQVILVTAHGTVEDAVDALAQGAADYVTKPFRRASSRPASPRPSSAPRSSARTASSGPRQRRPPTRSS